MPDNNGTHVDATKKHLWQFRDQKIPARIFFLLSDGKITATDLLLFCVIDAMVKAQGSKEDEAGTGCWASNSYLAKAVNANPAYVSQRLSELKKSGLLLIVNVANQRYLELEWSRTAEERWALAGEYGDECRKEHQRTVKRLKQRNETKTPSEKSIPTIHIVKPKSSPIGTPIPPLKENLYQSNKDNIKYRRIDNCRRASPDDGEHASLPPKNGQAPRQGNGDSTVPKNNTATAVKKKPFAERVVAWACRKLRGKIINHVGIRKKWPLAVSELETGLMKARDLKRSEARRLIDAVFKDHFAHLEGKFQPQLFSVKTMCDGFLRLEGAMKRRSQGRDQESLKLNVDGSEWFNDQWKRDDSYLSPKNQWMGDDNILPPDQCY